MKVKARILSEDPRYPTLVLESKSFGTVGYSINSNGALRRVCLCFAKCACECACGAWDAKEEG